MASPERESQTFLQISRKRLKRQYHSSYHHLDHANTSFTHVDHSVDLPDDVLDMIFSFLPIKKSYADWNSIDEIQEFLELQS